MERPEVSTPHFRPSTPPGNPPGHFFNQGGTMEESKKSDIESAKPESAIAKRARETKGDISSLQNNKAGRINPTPTLPLHTQKSAWQH